MSDKAKQSEDKSKSKKDPKIVNTDMFTFQISDNKGKSREEFDKACQEAISSIHGSWRMASRATLHACIHNIKFNDSTLLARVYGRVVNETGNAKMALAIKTVAKQGCAVSIVVDKSKTGKDDIVKIYKGTRDKDEWAKLWDDPKEGPAKCVEVMRKLETCMDDEIKTSTEFGLGLFLEKRKNSGGSNRTATGPYHVTGKEFGDKMNDLKALSEKLKDRGHPEVALKLEMFEEQLKALNEKVAREVVDAQKLLGGVAAASGLINQDESSQDGGASNDTDGDDETPEQDKAA